MKGLFWGKEHLKENYVSCKHYLLKLNKHLPALHLKKVSASSEITVRSPGNSSVLSGEEKLQPFSSTLNIAIKLMVGTAYQKTEIVPVLLWTVETNT